MKLMQSKTVRTIVLTLILLVASTAIPRHLGPKIFCEEYEGRTHVYVQREQFGLPLVLAKRTISSSSCDSWGQNYKTEAPFIMYFFTPTNPDPQHEILDNGYIIILNALIDIAFWTVISYLILTLQEKFLPHQRS